MIPRMFGIALNYIQTNNLAVSCSLYSEQFHNKFV